MRNWYSIQNKADKEVEILIYDVIGKDFWGEGVGAKEFAEEVSNIKAQTINLRINSPGGAVFEGTAIYNTLKNHPANINVHIDGMALSAASFIAMAGDTVTMADNAMFMIHDPWGMSIGTAEDLRKEADMMDKAKINIIKTYQNKVDMSDKALSDLMSAETWMDAEEAKEYGFVDEISGSVKMAASYDSKILNNYKHVPAALTNSIPDGAIEIDDLIKGWEQDSEMKKELDNARKEIEEKLSTGRSISMLNKEIDLLDIE